MTTTDTDALTERIAMAWNESTPEQWAEMDRHRHGPGLKSLALQDAARILPIVAEEVRKAKAEALREAAEQARSELGWASGGHTSTHSVRHWLRKLATEYETGDSDEHR